MNKTALEVKEDEVFYALDDVLEEAIWRRGRIFITFKDKTGLSTYTCSSKRTLRDVLIGIAKEIKENRFPDDTFDVVPIVDNILVESAQELEKFRIPDNKMYR